MEIISLKQSNDISDDELALSNSSTLSTTFMDKTDAKSLSNNNINKYPFRVLVLFSVYNFTNPEYLAETYIAETGILPNNDINQCESKLVSFLNDHQSLNNLSINQKSLNSEESIHSLPNLKDLTINLKIGRFLIDSDKSNNSIIWQASIGDKVPHKVTFHKPRIQSGTCIFYQLVGSDKFLECKVYYRLNEDVNETIKLLCDNGIEFGGRHYFFLCGEQPRHKNKNEKERKYFKCHLYSGTGWDDYSLQDTSNDAVIDTGYKSYNGWQHHLFKSSDSVMNDPTICTCNLGGSSSILYQSVDHLIATFADFKSSDKIKRNARLLLGFSCCSTYVLCEEQHITIIKDITSLKGNLMTDGCGFISSSYFENFSDKSLIPIVIQIRAISCQGLFKGILVVTSNESICKRGEIKMRHSMKKADGSTCRSYHEKVFIFIKNTFQYEKFHWAMTTHELMLLLLHGGVPGDVFMSLLMREVEKIPPIKPAYTSRERDELLKNLRRLNEYSHHYDDDSDDGSSDSTQGYIDNVQKLIELLESRHDPSTEVYLKDLLGKVQVAQLKKLASLKVPLYDPDADIYATSLVGIPDPLGVLEENEVYVSMNFKLTSRGSGSFSNGDVLVSRYPMGHPGDIRKMKLKRCPELDEFIGDKKGGIVLFSTQGHRSAADMMGGGDFDGDTFLIIYGKNIVVQSFKESEAFVYGCSTPKSPTSTSQSYGDVVRSLTKLSVLGEFANKRKACIEKYGADHEHSLSCHKVASDELEKKNSNDNDELIKFLRQISIPLPTYEITINESDIRNKKYEKGSSILTAMHDTVLELYDRCTVSVDVVLNPNFKPDYRDSGTSKYIAKWRDHLTEWNKEISNKRDDGNNKFTEFLSTVDHFKSYFENDVADIVNEYEKLWNESEISKLVPKLDIDKSARKSLAKIIYHVTYEKELGKDVNFRKVPKFCWWVCFDELNLIQREYTMSMSRRL